MLEVSEQLAMKMLKNRGRLGIGFGNPIEVVLGLREQ
jgi:hypothetical protein